MVGRAEGACMVDCASSAKVAKPASEHGAGNEGVQHERGEAEQGVGPGEQAVTADDAPLQA